MATASNLGPKIENYQQHANYVYLTMIANAESNLKGDPSDANSVDNIQARLQQNLTQPDTTTKDWFVPHELLWLGINYATKTAFKKKDYDNDLSITEGTPTNIMYLARNKKNKSEYFLGIAGTNPDSYGDWFDEDFSVRTSEAWSYGATGDNAGKISTATNIGLQFLINQKDRISTEHLSLQKFLAKNLPIDAELVVGGHSLGGALAPTFALWLQDTRSAWGNKENLIRVYSLAGASPGSDIFSNYLQKRIVTDQSAKTSNPASLLYRMHNTMDIVPHSWQLSTIQEIPTLYENEDKRDGISAESSKGIKGLANCFEAKSKGYEKYKDSVDKEDLNKYTPIQGHELAFKGTAADFPTKNKYKVEITNNTKFKNNALYQHVTAYFSAVKIVLNLHPDKKSKKNWSILKAIGNECPLL